MDPEYPYVKKSLKDPAKDFMKMYEQDFKTFRPSEQILERRYDKSFLRGERIADLIGKNVKSITYGLLATAVVYGAYVFLLTREPSHKDKILHQMHENARLRKDNELKALYMKSVTGKSV